MDIEHILCRIFRKGDPSIREFLTTIMGNKYFTETIRASNMFIIFLYCDINLRLFIEKCIYECEEKIIEVYEYFSVHNKDKAKEMENILWRIGNFNILAQICRYDLQNYRYLYDLQKRM